MSEDEIALTRRYLEAARLDPVAALIRSVRDLLRLQGRGWADAARVGDDAVPPEPAHEAAVA